jgi:hypothetical protein
VHIIIRTPVAVVIVVVICRVVVERVEVLGARPLGGPLLERSVVRLDGLGELALLPRLERCVYKRKNNRMRIVLSKLGENCVGVCL